MKKNFRSYIYRSLIAISAAAVGLTSFAGCSKEATDSDLAYIKDKGTLVIGMTLFAPMDYYADENEIHERAIPS